MCFMLEKTRPHRCKCQPSRTATKSTQAPEDYYPQGTFWQANTSFSRLNSVASLFKEPHPTSNSCLPALCFLGAWIPAKMQSGKEMKRLDSYSMSVFIGELIFHASLGWGKQRIGRWPQPVLALQASQIRKEHVPARKRIPSTSVRY